MAEPTTYTLLSDNAPDWWLDEPLRLAAAGRELPGARGAKSVSPSAVCRWIHSGKLQAVKCGRRLLTSRRYLRAMLERNMNEYRDERGIGAPARVRTQAQGDRAADAAARRMGITIEK